MQKSLEKRVLEYCGKHRLLEKGDSVVVGVSGGADSVCLLFVLLHMRDLYDLKLHVVHVNHGIREDASEDAAYVKELCEIYKLPFYLYEKDIPALAIVRGCSQEEAGRLTRYEAFEEVLQKQNCQRIAVAHNRNDRAETMLFHLFRGTGLSGLASIRPKREQIIRPLLCIERAEIETYLKEKQIGYRHDSTNDSDDYTRNKIRHNLLPYAEEEVVKGSVANMARTADILAETENYIEEQVQKAEAVCVSVSDPKGKGYQVDIGRFLQEHSLIQKRLLLQLLNELSPQHKDIAAIHVEDACELFHRSGNRSIHLPYHICARREYETVILEKVSEQDKGQLEPLVIDLAKVSQEELCVPMGRDRRLYLKRINRGCKAINCEDIPQNQYTKWFDCDKIDECLTLRTRESGDYLCIKGKEGTLHKKLKDYMISEKIPVKRRVELPLLAQGSHILWVIGYRISEYYKVDAGTKCILQVRFEQNSRIEQ